MNIADILIAGAALGFLLADVKQAWKLYRYKSYSTEAISRTHWIMKIVSLLTVISGYIILCLVFATIVAIVQLLLSIYVLYKLKHPVHKRKKNHYSLIYNPFPR